MKPEQIRAAMGDITKKLEGIVAGDKGWTAEQLAEIKALNAEFKALDEQLDAAESMEAMQQRAAASAGRKTTPVSTNKETQVTITRNENERFGGFKNSGEFLVAVKKASSGQVHQILASPAYERDGEDGGFLVPEEIAAGIVKKLDSPESMIAGTTPFSLSGNSLTINVDESQPWNSGVQAYWMAEGGPFTGTKPSFKQAEFKLKKLGALVVCTDELLDDATALASYIQAAAPDAIMHKINGAMISGNGVGKPSGIINSPFTLTQAAESMQAADTIVARNIINMYSKMIPQARAGAAWYMNAQCEAQLLGMVDDNDNFIYLAPGSQLNQSPYGLLLGRPVYPLMSHMPALGDVGDIIFANLKYYYSCRKAGGGIKAAESIHLYFDTEKTAYRFSMRVDGKVPFQTPVTTEFGSHQMSGFVQLAAR